VHSKTDCGSAEVVLRVGGVALANDEHPGNRLRPDRHVSTALDDDPTAVVAVPDAYASDTYAPAAEQVSAVARETDAQPTCDKTAALHESARPGVSDMDGGVERA